MGPRKGGPLPRVKGRAHLQTWAYFSSMICAKYPLTFIQTAPLKKLLNEPNLSQAS
jgi:hypothetical protein